MESEPQSNLSEPAPQTPTNPTNGVEIIAPRELGTISHDDYLAAWVTTLEAADQLIEVASETLRAAKALRAKIARVARTDERKVQESPFATEQDALMFLGCARADGVRRAITERYAAVATTGTDLESLKEHL